MTETVRPTSIRLEASSFCQLRCPSCPTTSRAIHPAVGSGFLRLDKFRRLLDENPALKRIELSNYGEIFLNPQLTGILELAHQRGVALSAGNGVNLNTVRPEVLEAVVKYRLRAMTCSIDGASEETYAIYRVRGKFATVIANIRAINEWKKRYRSPYPVLTWQFVVFGHNEHEVALARTMARELGMNFFAKLIWDDEFSPVREKEAVREATATGAASRAEFEALHGLDYMGAICHQLWVMPQINWDGKVLGCARNFWGDFGGNAFADGLEASVNGEKMVYAREMLVGRQPARDDIPCTTCEIFLNMRERGRWLEREAPTRRVRLSEAETLARANKLADLGRLTEAAAIYRAVLTRDGNHVAALVALGVIAVDLGDRAGAAILLRRAAALRPANPEIAQQLARALAP